MCLPVRRVCVARRLAVQAHRLLHRSGAGSVAVGRHTGKQRDVLLETEEF